jgi:predicted metalloendopeptidase
MSKTEKKNLKSAKFFKTVNLVRKVKKYNNITKKYNKISKKCPIGLKPFEKKFSDSISNINSNKYETQTIAEFAKQLLKKFSPTYIKPNDDFYTYINYEWIKNVKTNESQKYIVEIDDFRLAQDKVYNQLNDIILNYTKTNNNELSKNLTNFYNSVIKMNSIKNSKKIAKELVTEIDDLIKENNVWKMLAYINKDEMTCTEAPFIWSLSPDDKDPTTFRSYINPHNFNLLDINVYFDDGTDIDYKKHYRNESFKTTKELFRLTLGPNNGLDPKDVFDVEVEMFNVLGCQDITKKEKSYNKVYKDESLTKYGFDWKEFSTELGFETVPNFFITSSLNYLKCGTELMIKNWKTPKWRTYWIHIMLKRLARVTQGWETNLYKFYGNFERGQEGINDTNSVSASLYLSVPFNTFLTQEYVAKYKNEQVIEYVNVLCNDLKIVFHRILTRNTWLSPATKKYALTKLKHLNFMIANPTILREDPLLDYNTSLYDNMIKIYKWRHQQFIISEGKPSFDLPLMDWTQYPVKLIGTQAYIVNASYTPSKNGIYINLGYMQKPFIDMDERGIEYNLAHLGFTIGHEMSHGFDDWGSQYDYKGRLYDWWSESDKKKFKEIQKDVIKQYHDFAARDGIIFDAAIGIGEDMADISGMHICNEYLRDFQENNNDVVPIRSISYETFYTYYAIQQKQKVNKKAISAQLKTNPHPPDKYRCNIPLSRSEVFRALYNVKKGDDMWWHNTNTIW